MNESRSSRLRRGCLRFVFFLSIAIVALIIAGLTALVAVLNHFSKGLPDVTRLRHYEPSETTRIYASDGSLIATLYKENRTWTPFDQMSPYLKQAVLAVEDSRFYSHHGVDPIGVLRAAVYDLTHRGAHQGASTITMQLARNLFLTPRQSMDRKIREMLLALEIEKKFSKEEILELYLNQIYFGAGAYGVESAAKTYYNKNCRDLSIAEAALIAGLPQAPSEFSPLVSVRQAQFRQILVLGRMVNLGFITWEQYRQALDECRHPHFAKRKQEEFQVLELPYFTTYVLKQLFDKYDEDYLYRGGLRIYTTVDPKLQRLAEYSVREGVARYGKKLNADSAALVCIENKSGYIRALAGGLGWSDKSQFNRAWQARRHPGSSFKLFVYTAAVEAGYSPDTIIADSPVKYDLGPTETWEPKNSDRAYMGDISMRTALQYSRNVVAVKLLTMVGMDQVIDLAYRMGIQEKLYPHLSLALGAVEVSPLEMASAYSVMGNGGVKAEVTPVKIIYDSQGNIVEDHTFAHTEEVLSETTATIMTEMLMNVVENGTGQEAIIPGRKVAGKTGTTDDYRDAWFCGFTPQLTAAVWVGNDDNSTMRRSFGGDLPAKIWNRFMKSALKGQPALAFGTIQDGKQGVLMCSDTKKRATTGCFSTYRAFFDPKAVPLSFCALHGRGPGSVVASSRGSRPNAPTGPIEPDPLDGPAPEAIPAPNDPLAPEPLGLPTATPDQIPESEDFPEAPEAIPEPPASSNEPLGDPGTDFPAPPPPTRPTSDVNREL